MNKNKKVLRFSRKELGRAGEEENIDPFPEQSVKERAYELTGTFPDDPPSPAGTADDR
jgi:hypothetical protein